MCSANMILELRSQQIVFLAFLFFLYCVQMVLKTAASSTRDQLIFVIKLMNNFFEFVLLHLMLEGKFAADDLHLFQGEGSRMTCTC